MICEASESRPQEGNRGVSTEQFLSSGEKPGRLTVGTLSNRYSKQKFKSTVTYETDWI